MRSESQQYILLDDGKESMEELYNVNRTTEPWRNRKRSIAVLVTLLLSFAANTLMVIKFRRLSYDTTISGRTVYGTVYLNFERFFHG